ncbi:hypothetical protein R3W88_023978 [Solanum pinnatisectum]|uniref:Uncharacterized protein n=1 Tax=Solanum pinnatisectum TaxID=50273 RepID=A0AAV9LYY6_9SOLN|nr:hypothetical protein R3W88_023978 [Solanum pinnatisectum]
MWPALVVAAAAGSGFLAKKIFNQNATEPISGSTESDSKCDKLNDPEEFMTSFQHKDSIFTSICDKPFNPQGHKDSIFISNFDKPFDPEGFNTPFQHKDASFVCNLGCSIQEKSEGFSDGSIFRFSSASGSEMGFRNLRKKNVEGSRKTKGNVMEWKGNSGRKLGKKCGNVRSGEKELFRLDQRKRGNGKRFYVCLKKRRTNKVPSGKCDSCASKGNSFFGYGLGIGMMCMMSAGKSEINRLNTTMDETAKAVEELKVELSRRKVAHNLRASKNKGNIDEKSDRECRIRAIAESSNENRNIYGALDLQVAEEGECASSVVTEEPQPEVMEMDQLEAELESELLKLPWCVTEDTNLNGGRDPCRKLINAMEYCHLNWIKSFVICSLNNKKAR